MKWFYLVSSYCQARSATGVFTHSPGRPGSLMSGARVVLPREKTGHQADSQRFLTGCFLYRGASLSLALSLPRGKPSPSLKEMTAHTDLVAEGEARKQGPVLPNRTVPVPDVRVPTCHSRTDPGP
jgi:hypothetical protein